jgi:hypothetical protein
MKDNFLANLFLPCFTLLVVKLLLLPWLLLLLLCIVVDVVSCGCGDVIEVVGGWGNNKRVGRLWLDLFWNLLVVLTSIFEFVYCVVQHLVLFIMSLTKIKLNFNFNLVCLVFLLLLWIWKLKKIKYKKIKQNAKDLHLDLEKGDKRKKMMQKL